MLGWREISAWLGGFLGMEEGKEGSRGRRGEGWGEKNERLKG